MFELRFVKRYKQYRNVKKLVRDGILTPVGSFEEYTSLVKDAKKNAEHRLFTNCYMLPDEIKRLIALKKFYSVKTNNGIAFVDDEDAYYYMFLYVDLTKELELPQLDRNTLVEAVFYKDKKTAAQEEFEALIRNSGYRFTNTYISGVDRPQIPPEKYWKKLDILEKSLAAEGKRFAIPTYKQLKAFERIYRQEIPRYTQKRYTKKERRQQADQGLLRCITDNTGNIYAIQIDGSIHGGAIASREDCRDTIYAPALSFIINQFYYKNMPEDPQQRAEYMRSKGIGGWIAVDNKSSWRLHKMLGIGPSDKAFDQFVRPGFAE